MLRAVLAALVAAVVLPAAPATAAPDRPVVPCSRGLVALTFDDGPLATVTPQVVRLLTRLEVPATFFMVGNRVETHPELVRMVDRAGFAIGNHTWEHADLTAQRPAEAREALAATQQALLDAGVQPTDLARPPYGAVNDRVRRMIAKEGLVPVLWTVDSSDWTGLTPKQIQKNVLTAVRPHRTNVVLHHDGVTNSPATLKALPGEIAALRERGYCFAALDADGNPTPPVPRATVRAEHARLAEGDRVRLTVRLDRPTTRATRVPTPAGPVRIPAGEREARIWFRAPQDRVDERVEDLGVVKVVDDDPPPVVSVDDADVTASPLLPTTVAISARLDRPRDRDLPVVVRTRLGNATIVVPAFATKATGSLTVPVGTPDQRVRRIPMRGATLTVRPPEQTWLEAARASVAEVRWPVVRIPPTF
ncbi:polysaccharide deacetylase family protein [Nocardioides sp. SR21]|uniref:polysaccharide deacetylase family protein n=1 Tax=Nocardioides sp. SR21 TaxID=2919501 RepID=UPI001FA97602|nr:polysaccharide deacetylase family protein [Nocardioides sp. SR21]